MIRPNPLLKVYVAETAPANPSLPRIVTPIPHPKGSQCANSANLFGTPARRLADAQLL